MLGILLMTLIFIGALVGFSKMADLEEVKKNWSKYRCRPDVMLMADYYGHDSSENMEFCLKSGFDFRSAGAVLPFYSYLKSFVDVLMNMLSSLNSIRLTFATIVGSVTNVFSEFSSRIKSLFSTIQITSIRMKMLMGRIFATLYSIIFMGMAGIKATTNFGNTFLFKFLDTFCFDPDTLVLMKKGPVKIRDVVIGDIFHTGERVTATFAFKADGQSMVDLGGITVSTNHYVKYNNKWIKASSHPEAQPTADWSGGSERPLICLNTDKHSFPVGAYTFSDYDETAEGDEEAMKMAMDMLNGPSRTSKTKDQSSEMACGKETLIQTKGVPVQAQHVVLGTPLTQGIVIGVIQKECHEVCVFRGERYASGTAIWSESEIRWIRASEISRPIKLNTPEILYSFVVSPSACITTTQGTVFRDYVEVHTPDLELPYAASLNPLSI
jgi:hypothetical protein